MVKLLIIELFEADRENESQVVDDGLKHCCMLVSINQIEEDFITKLFILV